MEKEKGKHLRKKKWWKKLVILAIFAVTIGLVGYITLQKLKQEYTVTYDAYSASIGTISNSLSFSGSLKLIDDVTFTANTASTVREVYIKERENVTKGQKLMRLNNGQIVNATFDGTVNVLYAESGEEVSAGDSLVQIADFEHMYVSIRVDEYDINDVSVGQECRITTTATENEFTSFIDSINYVSASTGNVAYYTATAYVDVSSGVYPGMQVTVTIPLEEAKDVVVLKLDAISFDRTNQAFVYMQKEDGTMEERYIQTGVSNGNYVEITDGLNAGDTVYTESAVEAQSGITNLLTGIFGSQQINGDMPGGGRTQRENRDFSNFDFSNMPGGGGTGGFGGGAGGSRP